MAPPEIASPTIEQAIYTWSEINRGGNKGLGFGAVSRGLRNHSDWLSSWPTARFQLRTESSRGADAFVGWEDAVTLGAFQVDDFNVVYRKIPSAGKDGFGRNRHVVHALVGQAADIDLARIGWDSEIWCSAADCPLDNLPSLSSLSAASLVPPSFAHSEDQHGNVLDLVELLRSTSMTLVLDDLPPEDAQELVRSLHVAIPTELWPNLELTFHLASDGLRAAIAVSPRSPGGQSESPEARLDHVELVDCELHHRIDHLWHSSARRSWNRLMPLLTRATLVAPQPPTPPTVVSGDPRANGGHSRSVGETVQSSMRDLVAGVTGWPEWNYEHALDDLAIARLLSSSRVNEILPTWLEDARQSELRAVLAHVHERRTYAALDAVLSSVGTKALIAAWQRSAAAPLGYALAGRGVKRNLGKRWALPSVPADDHTLDAQLLAEQLVTSEPGHEACIAMFEGGILRHPEWRRQMVDGLLAAKANPQFVFDRLMVAAGADDRILCEVALDHLDDFASWLRLPDAYRDAFRIGLAKPRWFWRFTRVLSEQRVGTTDD